jgi:WD40 repeat protein
MSADMVNAAPPPGSAGKRRTSLRWRQPLLVVLLLLVLAPVGLGVGYKILHRPTTQAVAFSPDGHLLAAGSTDDRIRIWDVQNGTLLHTLSSETMKDVFALAFSPDGRVLASWSDGIAASWTASPSSTPYQAVSFWDVTSGRRLSASNGGLLVGYSLAFSPDGRMLAVAALNGIAL